MKKIFKKILIIAGIIIGVLSLAYDGNLPTYWIAHFETNNAEIPENLPGSNPGDLSQSDKIEIVFRDFQ